MSAATLHSMTGYGEARLENERHRVGVSVRSVNHRFLDLVVRLPEEHRALEAAVAEAIRGAVCRGRVEARIAIEPLIESSVELDLHVETLRRLAATLESARGEGVAVGELAAGDLLRLPQLLSIRETPPDWRPADRDLVLAAVESALGQLLEARAREGESLRRVLLERIDELTALVERLERRRSVVAESTEAALRARLDELLGDGSIPEERLAQEAALLVERADVREELDRLGSHFEHFRAAAAEEGPHGRRLEFVSQEIQRELNTLGGKCRDPEMSRDAVEAKLVCEQVREQVSNVE